MKTDITIIGGGVIGVCTAYYLLKRGRGVTLLERGEICSGSSYGNAGLIVPGHSIPLAAPGVVSKAIKWMGNPESPFYIKPRADAALASWLWRFNRAATTKRMHAAIPVLYRLSRESKKRFEALIADEGLLCSYESKGLVGVYRTEEGLSDGRKEVDILTRHGVDVEILDGKEIHDRAGGLLKAGVIGGVHFKEDAHLVPSRFVETLAERVTAMGGDIRTETEVIGIESDRGGIQSLRTTRGVIEAEQVVLAAGSWSPGVASGLALNLPIQPGKGYSVTYKRPDGWPDFPINLSEAKMAVTPMGPYVRFGGTMELAGLDMTLNLKRVEAILRGARHNFHGIDEMIHVETWRGLRPCTPDGMPILGRSPKHRNLTLATGHAMLGVSLGPITGDIAAAITCNETPDFDLALLRPERFQ